MTRSQRSLAECRHGVHHRRRRRRHGHRRRARRRRDRPRGDRRADGRRGHEAVLASRAACAATRRSRASSLLSQKVDTLIVIPNDRLLEIVDEEDQHARRLPHCRRYAAPGHPGRHGPDHHPRPHQPRLRRHPHRHEGRRFRHDGHRHRLRREPRAGRRAAGHQLQPAGVLHRRRHRACCSPSPAPRTSHLPRSTRRPAPWKPAQTRTRTSSTARSSTRAWATRSASRSSPPDSRTTRSRAIRTTSATCSRTRRRRRSAAQPAAETYNPAPSYNSNNDSNRFSDEDYIPDFLKR